MQIKCFILDSAVFSDPALKSVAMNNTGKKSSFPLKNFSLNVTKSTVSCGFGHIY